MERKHIFLLKCKYWWSLGKRGICKVEDVKMVSKEKLLVIRDCVDIQIRVRGGVYEKVRRRVEYGVD